MQHLQVSAEDLSSAERPSVESSVVALLKLCSSSKADIKVVDDAIELSIQGGPAAVQPTRRGRGAGGRGGVSSLLWPDGFTWTLAARLTDAESLMQLADPPELTCTCSTCEDSSNPLETVEDALKFMEQHSGHNSSWSMLLNKQEAALEQDLTQLLQQVQQHAAEGLVLPIQRAAALISVEAAHMVLLSDDLAQNGQLKQLALAILHHRIIWHMTSSYRPAKAEDFQQIQLAVGPNLAPHLLWLVAGAPPYCQSATAAPDAAKHCSLEARALVAYMRRCNLFQQPSKKAATPVTAPTDLQLLTALQQLLQQGSTAAGGSGGSTSARLSFSGSGSQPIIDSNFLQDLLSLRGLTLDDLVQAAEETGTSSQLDFCAMCGSSSSTTQERLMHCKSCCHAYHASCALAAGNADGSYTMQTYPKAREGFCLGCQHFPLRSEAEGGFNWESAAEDAESEAAAAAAAGAAKHVARAKGASGAGGGSSGFGSKGLLAAAVAAAAAAERATGDHGGSSSGAQRASSGPGAASASVKPESGSKSSKPLAASAAANGGSSSSGGQFGKPNKHMVRGPNGKFVSLRQQQPNGVMPALGSKSSTHPLPSAAGAPVAAAAGVGDSSRPGSSSASRAARVSTGDGSNPSAAAAAAGDLKKEVSPAAAAAAAVTPQGVSSSRPTNSRVVLCCEPLVPGSAVAAAAEPTDINALRQHVLDRLSALNLVPTGDSGMLLRRALLKEGHKLDYIDNQGLVAAARFEVVMAAAGRKGDKQQLLCHACKDRHLATWKEAEDHLAYDSGGHSTQYLKFVGSKTSVKDLWQQVQEAYKRGQRQQQQQGVNVPVSPAMDAAHALQMLASACDTEPFGGGGAAAAAAAAGEGDQQQQQRKDRKERSAAAVAGGQSMSPTSSFNAGDAAAPAEAAAAARKRPRGDKSDVDQQQRHASSSNVSDTITVTEPASPSADQIRPRKRQRRQQQQQREIDPIALKWRLARVAPVIRQQIDQLLSSPHDLVLCAVLVEFWVPSSSSSSSSDGGRGSASTSPTGAAAASVIWDLSSIQSDDVASLVTDIARASLASSSSSTAKAAAAAAEDVLDFCLAAVKAAYGQPGKQQQQQQQGDLIVERRCLVSLMLRLGLAAFSSNSSSSSVAAVAEVLAVGSTAVCSSHCNVVHLKQIYGIFALLLLLMDSLTKRVWRLLAGALTKHVAAAAAAAKALNSAHAFESNACQSRNVKAGMHALQQLLDLIKQSPNAWGPALVRVCSSSGCDTGSYGAAAAADLAGSSSSSVLEVIFDAFMQGYLLELQCGARQADRDLQQQQQHEAEDDQMKQEQQQKEVEQLPADSDGQQQQQAAGKEQQMQGDEQQETDEPQAAAAGDAPAVEAGAGAAADDDVDMTDAVADDQQQQKSAAAKATAAEPANGSEGQVGAVAAEEQQRKEGHEIDHALLPAAAAENQEQQQQLPAATAVQQERLKAAQALVGSFVTALTAAARWLVQQQQQQQDRAGDHGDQPQQQRHKAEDLLVNLIGLQYQVLHALLLSDAELHDVLQFVDGGLHSSLVGYTEDMLHKARKAFGALTSSSTAAGQEAAAAAAAEAANLAAAGDGEAALVDHQPQQQQQQQQQVDEGAVDVSVLAYDCKYVAETLAETVGYVVKHKSICHG